MSLGQEFAEMVVELLTTDQDFGSTMRWRHFASVENANTGAVAKTPTEVSFRGGVVDPARTRLFGDSTLVDARCAVVALPSLPFVPALLDQVEITPGRWLRVIDLKEPMGPGDAGSPVLIAYVAALGAS